MDATIRDHYEAFPDPSPSTNPIVEDQLGRIDDSLHYGWSWHRYRFAYRKSNGVQILDAGCGTGLSTLGLAKLNPEAQVIGVDFSPRSLALANERAKVDGLRNVEFREHDLDLPIPEAWGKFDFVVARNLLGNSEDPSAILTTLSRSLDPRGLLLATFPSAMGRMPARQMRRAIDALVGPDSSTTERAEMGLELLSSLRLDHPIRRFDVNRHAANPPSLEQFVATYLNDRSQAYSLEDALERINKVGLKCLFVADRGGWRPDRIFLPSITEAFRDRVGKLDEADLSRLKDALDVSLHVDSYHLYTCHAGYEPHIPGWPDDDDLTVYDRLIPHATGLAIPARMNPDPASGKGRVTYRSINGGLGEIELRSDLSLRQVNGVKTIGEIETQLNQAPFTDDGSEARRARWFELAHLGFVLLEAPDPRQNVDCIHLGAIKDRLDCACPRRWIRGCEVHSLCTISTVGKDDPRSAALTRALDRLGQDSVIACDRCPDYSAEEVVASHIA